MFDFNFNWDDNLNTNIDIIDEQHKELFRIGRDIEQLILTNCINVNNKVLLTIICDLREYIAYSFYQEESMMEQYNYKNMKEHKEVHQYYKHIIETFDVKRLGQEPLVMLKKLREILIDFVMSHMLIEDIRMAKEISQVVSN